MRRHVAVAMLVACVLLAACRSKVAGCKAGEPFCYCARGASCTQTCGATPRCALHCANENGICTLTGGDESNVACQGSLECRVESGARSMVACQGVTKRCAATVGDGSQVHCEGAAMCEIACTGACDVDCPGGHCRVRCADPKTCNVQCGKSSTSRDEACVDPTVKVCGASCT